MEQITKYKRLSYKLQGTEKQGIVTLYANAFNNIDSDGDVSLPGSFKRTINNNLSRIKHLYNHDRSAFIGLPIEMKEDDLGLLVVSKLNLNTKLGQDVFADYEFYKEMDRSPEHSIGAKAIKYKIVDTPERNTGWGYPMDVEEWKLFEYSTVPFGANDQTPMVELKSLNLNIDFEAAYNALEKMINMPYSDQTKRNIEKLAKLLSKYEHTHEQASPAGPQNAPEPPAKKALSNYDLQLLTQLIKI